MVRFNEKRRAVVAAMAIAALLGHGASANAGSAIYGAANGPAIGGYDPVAYFTQGAPKEGDPRYTIEWNGAVWRFASAENLARFKAEPERYAPQYGGYCAYAMSTDALSPGDAKRWRIEGGRLYLNANIIAQSLWETDIPKRVRRADDHWPARKQELEAKP